ncbi:family 1 encapsulin nanocompartment shell protein [Haliangium sp.]|uniref:family 1 encapsulin nanocompartment shell protein n=1 Tax=Haliangium sp. TaxID=2663208 RepID=UPI003D123033
MDLLKRDLAPVLPQAWSVIDDEARTFLTLHLAGRKLVDLRGPFGWEFAAVNTGERRPIQDTPEHVHMDMRHVKPLTEIRVPFRLDIAELDNVARGAVTPILGDLGRAAEKIAHTEDTAIFHGYAQAGITGIIEAAPHRTMPVASLGDFPRAALAATDTLRKAGINGPYALVLGAHTYDELFAAIHEGYPIAKQMQRQIVDGPLVRATALDGALVMSVRGGDYELTVGQDLSIGYAQHDARQVELYLTESFTFRVLEPAAAVHLTYG